MNQADSRGRAGTQAPDWARRLQVPLQEISLHDQASGADPWGQQFQRTDLLVCGKDVPSMYKKNLLRKTQRKGAPALLLCSSSGELPTRILLVDRGGPGADDLLPQTAKLCVLFRAGLVALTVARTEREARLRQRQARETPLGCPVPVNFDFLAGAEERAAVANVARWRHCQLVVLEATHASPWARWLGSVPGPWIMDLLDTLSFLVVPTMNRAALTPVSSDAAPGPQTLPCRPSVISTPGRGELVASTPHRPS